MPLTSPYYIVRPSDGRIFDQLHSLQPTVTIRGDRGTGKSSFLVRLRQQAIENGWHSCCLDLRLEEKSLQDSDALFLALARMTADELGIDREPEEVWSPRRGAMQNWTRFMERIVLDASVPTLLLFDRVDVALENDACRTDFFAMLRVWHDRRSTAIKGGWRGLGLAVAHRGDPAHWIRDINQSPFNVGLQVTLDEFGPDEIAELDRRHGNPLGSPQRRALFLKKVGGNPQKVRWAFYAIVVEGRSLDDL